MLFENQRRHVRQIADAINDREIDVGIIFRYLFHDRRLGKADSDDQIITALGKRSHRRLNRIGSSRLDISQDDRKIFGCALHSLPGSIVEGTIIFAANIENYPNVYLRLVVGGVTWATIAS